MFPIMNSILPASPNAMEEYEQDVITALAVMATEPRVWGFASRESCVKSLINKRHLEDLHL